jgi:hypothetical protein
MDGAAVMALIDCYECGKNISDIAPACPSCGAPAKRYGPSYTKRPKVGVFRKLIIVAFWGVVGLFVIGALIGKSNEPGSSVSSNTPQYGYSSASYREVDSQVGCKSQYSDDKKEDLFNELYRNKWMTWKGRVVLLEAGKVSIDMDGGTQDLSLRFEDPNAGYNLSKGTMLEVQFVMRSAGGCFLPFSGDKGLVLSAG